MCCCVNYCVNSKEYLENIHPKIAVVTLSLSGEIAGFHFLYDFNILQ